MSIYDHTPPPLFPASPSKEADHLRPSIFELLATEQLHELFGPVVRYTLAVGHFYSFSSCSSLQCGPDLAVPSPAIPRPTSPARTIPPRAGGGVAWPGGGLPSPPSQ